MRYMLMMHAPRATSDWQINSWSPDDFKAHMAFMHSYNKDLTAAGEFVAAEGLAGPGEAKVVRAGKDGVPVTDGPFAEAKEQLAGYYMVDAESIERATEIVTHDPAARFWAVEVRPIMDTAGTEM
jgi:hypothetical protein